MDISNLYYDDEFDFEEELSPEEQAEQDRIERKQAEVEAYAEFLQSPYAFDWLAIPFGGRAFWKIDLS